MNAIINWLLTVTGIYIPPGEYSNFYNFWSGIGSDITEFAILGGLISIYKKHTCHVDGCWRLGRHPVEGTPYTTCKKHHPTIYGKVTADRIAIAYKQIK